MKRWLLSRIGFFHDTSYLDQYLCQIPCSYSHYTLKILHHFPLLSSLRYLQRPFVKTRKIKPLYEYIKEQETFLRAQGQNKDNIRSIWHLILYATIRAYRIWKKRVAKKRQEKREVFEHERGSWKWNQQQHHHLRRQKTTQQRKIRKYKSTWEKNSRRILYNRVTLKQKEGKKAMPGNMRRYAAMTIFAAGRKARGKGAGRGCQMRHLKEYCIRVLAHVEENKITGLKFHLGDNRSLSLGGRSFVYGVGSARSEGPGTNVKGGFVDANRSTRERERKGYAADLRKSTASGKNIIERGFEGFEGI